MLLLSRSFKFCKRLALLKTNSCNFAAMGVRGLTSLISKNRILKNHELFNTTVVIDGNNIVHFLYANEKIDCSCGGDYSTYAAKVKEFFTCLKECNINSVVVFDGGLEFQVGTCMEAKRILKKHREKAIQHMQRVEQLIREGKTDYTILPLNAFEVFKDVLDEMGVEFVQHDYKCDSQVAALAIEYQCPVLSGDSDFYIYDLKNGFIRLSDIVRVVNTKKNTDGTESKYLNCRIYRIDALLKRFKLDKSVLPLLGTLAGNDEFEPFLSKIMNLKKSRLYLLIVWLKKCKSDQVKNHVLQLINKEENSDIALLLESCIKNYQIKKTILREILDAKYNRMTLGNWLLERNIIAPCGVTLPNKFVAAFRNGCLPSFLLTVITQHKMFLSTPVENFSNPSSYISSLYIRRVIYGILLQHVSDNSNSHNGMCLGEIDEYIRIRNELQILGVDFNYKLRNGDRVPKLTEIYDMDKECLRNFIAKVMGVEISFFSDFPDNLQLFFGCIVYCWNNSSKPTMGFLYSLLFCVIYYQLKETSEENINENKGETRACCFKTRANVFSFHSVSVKKFEKYLSVPTFDRMSDSDLEISDYFSQLQTCFLYFVCLNLLADCPFEQPKLYEIVSGPLLHNLSKHFPSRRPDSFVEELLGKESSLVELFNRVKSKILENIPGGYFVEKRSLEDTEHETKRKQGKGNKGQKGNCSYVDYS